MTGVCLDRGKYRAHIQHRGRAINLGLFNTEIEAVKVRDKAAKRLHGDKARLNLYRGVSFSHGQPQASIRTGGHMVHLGTFKTAELAARAYDRAARKYQGTKAKLNFTDRLLTTRQEEIYQCCSPDFLNLTQKQAAMVLGISAATVCREMQKIKEACPTLFPLYPPAEKVVRYSDWMDDRVVEKF